MAEPDIELSDEGSTAFTLSAPTWSCLLNYTSVQPLPLFSFPSSLLNLIRESADAVCAQLMWNQFKATHKNLLSLLLSHTYTKGVVCAICQTCRDPFLLILCLYISKQGTAGESWALHIIMGQQLWAEWCLQNDSRFRRAFSWKRQWGPLSCCFCYCIRLLKQQWQHVRTEEIQQSVTVVTILCAEFFKSRPLLDIIKKITLLWILQQFVSGIVFPQKNKAWFPSLKLEKVTHTHMHTLLLLYWKTQKIYSNFWTQDVSYLKWNYI